MQKLKNTIENCFEQRISLQKATFENEKIISQIQIAADKLIQIFNSSKKQTLFLIGNGGSAADCQHIAAEFVNKFKMERKPLRAIALTVDSSILTSVANDFGFEDVFSKQIEALCRKDDILFAFSTSGNSQNIINAVKKANNLQMFSICFTGSQACKLDSLANLTIKIPSANTPLIQEMHIQILHIICELVEKKLFN